MTDPPLQPCFFVQKNLYQGADAHLSRACNVLWPQAWPLGMNPKLMAIIARALVVIVALMALWCFRQPLREAAERRGLTLGWALFADEPVDRPWFRSVAQWTASLLLRAPALGLLHAATHDALLTPQHPLATALSAVLGPFQITLAVLILTQAALPMVGAMLVGTWLYSATLGWTVAADALPLVAVAVLYMLAPWQSHRLAPTALDGKRARVLRVAVGVTLIAAGYRDIFAYEHTASLLANTPRALDDPLARLLMMGHAEGFARETWLAAVGVGQMMGGVLIAGGVFTRVVAAIGALWAGYLLWLGFDGSSLVMPLVLTIALVGLERPGSELGAETPARGLRERAITWASLSALATVAIVPAMYLLTTLDGRGR